MQKYRKKRSIRQFLWGLGNFIMISLLLIVLLKSSDQITSNLDSL